MDNLKRVFERMDIKQIRTFLLCGIDDSEIDMRSYEQKLNEESKALYNRMEKLYPNGQQRDEFSNDISQALVAYEEVYTEVGMKAGARLLFQLLQKSE